MAEPRRIGGVVEQVATSMSLLAVNRLGVPLLLAGVTWIVVQSVSLDRRVTMIERELETHLPRVTRLETNRETDQQRIQQAQSELITTLNNLRTDVSGIRADQAAMLRALTRLESISDSQRVNGGPR